MGVLSINSIEYNLLKNSSLGERIRLLRRKLMNEIDSDFYTTSAISERTGIAAPTITSIERGESKKPSFAVIHSLSKELRVPIEVFTDEFYEGREKLFSFGISPKTTVEVDVEIFDLDSIIIDNREYFTSDLDEEEKVWQHRRKVSISIQEETTDGEEKQLYHFTNHYKEMELIDVLSQLIQTLEMSPRNLSSSEWKEALDRSPLKEAYEIVSNK